MNISVDRRRPREEAPVRERVHAPTKKAERLEARFGQELDEMTDREREQLADLVAGSDPRLQRERRWWPEKFRVHLLESLSEN